MTGKERKLSSWLGVERDTEFSEFLSFNFEYPASRLNSSILKMYFHFKTFALSLKFVVVCRMWWCVGCGGV